MSHSVVSDSLQPQSPWNSPGKNTGVGNHSPGDLPNPGIEPGSPALQADALPSEPQEKPCIYGLYHLTMYAIYHFLLIHI